MPTFDELKRQYMLGGGGGSLSASPPFPTFAGSQVAPLLSGREYFGILKSRIAAVSGAGAFIYIAGWWLDPAFSLDSPSGAAKLTDLLIAKSRAGVDVRVLGWVLAPEVLQSPQVQAAPQVAGILGINADTMRFILALRAEPSLADKACLNILAHPAGAVHTKLAVVGSDAQAWGYTGGLDLKPDRHHDWWHDVQAEVTGPAAQGPFNMFREMWNEVRSRSPVSLTAGAVTCTSRSPGMPDLPARTLPTAGGGTVHVQSLRTLPRFNFSTLARIGAAVTPGAPSLPTNSPLSYAPAGSFEVRDAWEKAIKAAQTYIYIEDQGFTSGEVFDWICGRVKANAGLRVVLLIGGPDPNDKPNALNNKMLTDAVNNHLVNGLSPAQIDRIGFFRHKTKVVHTKSTIVDDQWAIIGSANCMRRSLYTDIEHSVAFMDEADRVVREYRRDLWGKHLGATSPDVTERDLTKAVPAWFAVPFAGTPSASPIERLKLPMPAVTISSEERTMIDEIMDPDSRQAWGAGLAALAIRAAVGSMSGP